MFTLGTAIKAMQAIGAVALRLPEVKAMIDAGISTLKGSDQAAAKESYHDLIADNAEGHARVQAKAAEAAKRP